MELLAVLSKAPKSKKKRKKGGFLLLETEEQRKKFLGEAKRARICVIGEVGAKAQQLFADAQSRRALAKRLLSSRWENDAECELARRDAARLREEAAKLRKKGREYRSAVRKMRLLPWRLPYQYDAATETLSSRYGSCRWSAKAQASNWEAEKIARESTVLRAAPHGDGNKYWQKERRLVTYRDQFFLVMMTKRAEVQPHEPWQVHWVTDSASQMTEEELRTIANLSSATN